MKPGHGKEATVIGGALSLTLATLIVKILGVIYKIPLANILGEEGMGYFNSAYTVYAFFYLLCTAGVPKAVMILVTEKDTDSGEGAYVIAKIATRVFLALGIVVTLMFILLSEPLSRLIGNSASRATMIAIAPSIVFISVAGVVRGLLSARMRLLEIAVSQILEGVGKLVLGLALAILARHLSLPLYIGSALTVLGVSLGALIGLVYLLCVANVGNSRLKFGQKITLRKAKPMLKRIFSISLPITASAAVMSLTSLIDLSIIMRRLETLGYSEAEAGALYGNYTTLAVPIFNLAVSIITPISIAFMPVLTRARVSADVRLRDGALRDAMELSAIVTAPLLVGTLAFSKEMLTLLFGNMNVSLGAPLLCLLIPGIFFMSPLLIINSALESEGHLKAPMLSMLAGALTKLLVSYIMLGSAEYGVSGAPIGTVVSYAVSLAVSLLIAFSKTDLKPPVLLAQLIPYPAAVGCVFLSKQAYLSLWATLGTGVAFVIAVLLCAVLYLLSMVLLGRITPERIRKMSKYTKSA